MTTSLTPSAPSLLAAAALPGPLWRAVVATVTRLVAIGAYYGPWYLPQEIAADQLPVSPPEFLPGPEQPAGILFLDELTAADQRLQISAYSLILDRRVGHYRLPDGWQVVAAGNASFHLSLIHISEPTRPY